MLCIMCYIIQTHTLTYTYTHTHMHTHTHMYTHPHTPTPTHSHDIRLLYFACRQWLPDCVALNSSTFSTCCIMQSSRPRMCFTTAWGGGIVHSRVCMPKNSIIRQLQYMITAYVLHDMSWTTRLNIGLCLLSSPLIKLHFVQFDMLHTEPVILTVSLTRLVGTMSWYNVHILAYNIIRRHAVFQIIHSPHCTVWQHQCIKCALNTHVCIHYTDWWIDTLHLLLCCQKGTIRYSSIYTRLRMAGLLMACYVQQWESFVLWISSWYYMYTCI